MRIMVAPMKVGQQTKAGLEFVKSKRPLISGLTEMDAGNRNHYIGMAKAVFGLGYDVLTDPTQGAHSEEIPLIVRRGPSLGVKQFAVTPISPDVGELGVGNDRYLAEMHFRYWTKTYAFLFTHTNAVVQNLGGKNPTYKIFNNERWRVSKEAWDHIEERAGHCIMNPKICGVFLAGDFNIMPIGEGLTDPHSPHQVMTRLGMKYVNSRVTYLGYWGVKPTETPTVFLPGQHGWPSDHAAILGKFRPNPHAVREVKVRNPRHGLT